MELEIVIAIILLVLMGFIILTYSVFIFIRPFVTVPKHRMVDGSKGNILTFTQFDSMKLNHKTNIPKLMFRTGEFYLDNIQFQLNDLYEKTIKDNPGLKVIYFSDEDRRHFIKKYYPRYLKSYDLLIPGAYRADLFRILVLHKYGGVYMDMGMKSLVSLDKIIDWNKYDFIIPQDGYEFGTFSGVKNYALFNGFMASKPKNKLLMKIAEQIDMNIRNRQYGDSVWDITGPEVVGKVLNRELKRSEIHAYNEKYLDIGGIRIKVLKLKVDLLLNNAFIYEKNGNGNRLIQVKLALENKFGLEKKIKDYRIHWKNGEVFNEE